LPRSEPRFIPYFHPQDKNCYAPLNQCPPCRFWIILILPYILDDSFKIRKHEINLTKASNIPQPTKELPPRFTHLKIIIVLLTLILKDPEIKTPVLSIKSNLNPETEKKIDALMAKMTLQEKIGQMNQYNGSFDVTGPQPNEAGAKAKYDNLVSGGVGSMLNVISTKGIRDAQTLALKSRLGIPLIIGYDVIHGYKTMFPIPLGESASWDMDVLERSSRIAGAEAAAAGINWTFAPMMDIGRDARWGRVMEGAGEDPFLATAAAVARVRGFQGESLNDDNTIAACAKHFAGYAWGEGGCR